MSVDIQLTREQLYEQLWTEPTIRVAARLGLSDVGLAKICRGAEIPIPPRGYWAKKRNGKNVRRARLPKLNEPIEFLFRPSEVSSKHKKPSMEYPQPVSQLIEAARALPQITVSSRLDDLHRFVENTRRSLEKHPSDVPSYSRPDDLVHSKASERRPVIDVHIGPKSITRAVLFLDALIKALELIGGKVVVGDEPHQPLRVHLCGQDVGDLVLTERRRQSPNPKWKEGEWFENKTIVAPSGELTFSSSTPWVQNHISDAPKSKIEDRINRVIIRWAENVGKQPIEKALAEERQREAVERERIGREQEEKRSALRREFEALQAKERQEIESLLAKTARWSQSRQIRDYLAAAREQVTGLPNAEETAKSQRWIEWANRQADRIDPLAISPPSFLDMSFVEYERIVGGGGSVASDSE